jgi:hypothetical protein
MHGWAALHHVGLMPVPSPLFLYYVPFPDLTAADERYPVMMHFLFFKSCSRDLFFGDLLV